MRAPNQIGPMREEELLWEVLGMRFRRPNTLENDLVLGLAAGAARRSRRDAVDGRLRPGTAEMLVLILSRLLSATCRGRDFDSSSSSLTIHEHLLERKAGSLTLLLGSKVVVVGAASAVGKRNAHLFL